ncbi:hypothetical protein GOODEAATRI_009359 [Goodea atripinnis]|uniref:Uncharacterized protein n=1 Tax=Goodea atripinnis TaxID=208336 RepID=A0ABV0NUT1_9TELE
MNGAVVPLVRDRGPAVPAQDKTGRPPFLIRNNLGYTPLSPSDSPERASVGAPDLNPRHPPSIHLHPTLSLLLLLLCTSTIWGAKVLLLWWGNNMPLSLIQGTPDPFSLPPVQAPE